MATTTTTKVKFYVQVVQECPDCDGTGQRAAWPNGYVTCGGCDGTGTIEDAVELTTALTDLGILPRLDQVEKTAGRAAYYADAMANGGI